MKAKVLHKFTDKYTGELYRRGAVLDITEERYKEIMSVAHLLQRIDAENALSVTDDDANALSSEAEESLRNDSSASGDGFDIMSVRELREYADKAYKLTFGRGVKKAEMIAELRRLEHGK